MLTYVCILFQYAHACITHISFHVHPLTVQRTEVHFLNFHILKTWSESVSQNRHVLTILDECCQSLLKYNHLKTENMPWKPLHISPGSKRLELIANTVISEEAYLHSTAYILINIFQIELKSFSSSYFQSAFPNVQPKFEIFQKWNFCNITLMNSFSHNCSSQSQSTPRGTL